MAFKESGSWPVALSPGIGFDGQLDRCNPSSDDSNLVHPPNFDCTTSTSSVWPIFGQPAASDKYTGLWFQLSASLLLAEGCQIRVCYRRKGGKAMWANGACMQTSGNNRRSTYEPPIDRIAKSMLESTSLIAISTQSFFVTVISSVIISQNTALLYLSQFLAKHSESTPSPKFRMERASAMLQFIATIALLTNQPFLSRFGLSVLCIAAMPKLVHTVRLFVSHWQALVTPPGKIRKGLRKYHRKKAIARENNINELVSIDPGTRSIVSNKKLKGLLSRGDTYNTSEFSDAHRSFKSLQNYIFIDLVHYITSTLPKTNSNHAHGAKVFYLDGSDAATTQAFRTAGFSDESMFVANLFPETSNLLKNQHGLLNVVTADAQTALRTPPFSKIPFLGYYFDGCGGQSGPVISMVEAIFNPHRPKVYEKIAIGFTLTRADPSGRSLFDREQDVLRSVFRAAKENGYNMVHVGDDPNRFLRHGREGRKLHEDTLSTWIMLEKNTR
eukprot:jgi/Bigna1/82249/fgenesh1_pg.89_\